MLILFAKDGSKRVIHPCDQLGRVKPEALQELEEIYAQIRRQVHGQPAPCSSTRSVDNGVKESPAQHHEEQARAQPVDPIDEPACLPDVLERADQETQ